MFFPVRTFISFLAITASFVTNAAISLQQTRVVFDGDKKTASLFVVNQNTNTPYLAQGWIEDEQNNRVQGPLLILPPIQRIEPGENSQIKIQALPAARLLRQDRETLFYLNLREIPPKNENGNTLQVALQNRIKVFYRPVGLKNTELASPWQSQLVLNKRDNRWQITNPSAYYITLVDAQARQRGPSVAGFTPLMLAPGASDMLPGDANSYGSAPVLTYLNDYGGRPEITFRCGLERCKVITNQVPR
ncbi:fimbria/pilus periplasmic chaperone [Erwinia sp. JUb26]|uniref:fimbria/pilus periplasmic chaperone n=1 Tax=Erwinia sp. JUb26 TaxID=2485126 RepID=UPI000F48DA66|nr:fimbria/pilus periplasmic chaperone [Erwinia sp. JUb26]ROR08671.1 P pilus assembly chaperone PapD [Erwinia sp. JUb26]